MNDSTCPVTASIQLKQQGKLVEAVHKLNQAIEGGHDVARAHYQRALIKVELHDDIAAEEDYRKALELRPNYTKAMNNLALLYNKRGALRHAEQLLRHAVELGEEDGVAETNLSMVLRQQHRPEALMMAQSAVQLAPNSPLAHCELGLATMLNMQANTIPRSQNPEVQAEKAFRDSLALDPTTGAASNGLAALLDQQGKHEEAIQVASEGLMHSPKDPALRQTLGCALLHVGKAQEALPNLQQVYEILPEHFESHYNLACALSQVGQVEQAIEHVRGVATYAPPHIRGHVLQHMSQDKDLQALHNLPEFRDALAS